MDSEYINGIIQDMKVDKLDVSIARYRSEIAELQGKLSEAVHRRNLYLLDPDDLRAQ